MGSPQSLASQPLHPSSFIVRISTLAAFLWSQARAELQPAKVVPSKPVAAKVLAPSELFGKLSRVTKPLWRQHYRSELVGSQPCRAKNSFALGAVMTDLALACAARDAQKLRNVAQESAVLEKSLGMEDKMTPYRQRILSHGDANDWEAARKAVELAYRRQSEVLLELKDGKLYTFVETGRWLRTWQITARTAIDRDLGGQPDLILGDVERLSKLLEALEPMAEVECAADPSLGAALKHLQKLHQLWTPPLGEASARLRSTAEMLAAALAPLLSKPTP